MTTLLSVERVTRLLARDDPSIVWQVLRNATITTGPSGGAVDSVNSQTGVVVLDADDVGAATQDYVDDSAAAVIAAAVMDGDGAGGALSGTFPNPGLNTEAVQDLIGAFLAAGSGVSLTYDDPGNVLTIAVSNLAITDTNVVASQAAMLALTAQRGDVAVRTDVSATFILQGNDPSTLADWVQLPTPTDAVLSVNGQTGVVVIPSDSTAATPSLRTLGTGAQQAAAGNDSRLSDARTPTAHNHAAAEITSGVIAIARLATGTPDGTKFIRDDGTLATPAGGSSLPNIDDFVWSQVWQ